MISKFAIAISLLIFWPASLYLANTWQDFFTYIIPGLLLALSLHLFAKKSDYFIFPTIVIPFISPKLALFPVLFSLYNFALNQKKQHLIGLFVATLVLVLSFSQFKGQTVLTSDYEARQQVIRDQELYPSILMARTFHNKAKVVTDKVVFNFFALFDLNNYFFGFHPHQISGNQNLTKYPFFAIFLFLLGIYNFRKTKYSKFILTSLTAGVGSLLLLTIFDRHDFLIFVPITLIALNGLNVMNDKVVLVKVFFWIFAISLIPEFVRLITADV